jgi:acyl-CoA synthetase (NDP forming)
LRIITGSEDAVSALYAPKNIAIIGASSKPYTISWWPLHLLQIHGFKGGIYPVNPGRDEIDGTRCYRSINDLPVAPDVAIIALDAVSTVGAVEDCARLGVKVVVLPTQGFGEVGGEGVVLEQRILEVARGAGLRIVGPNTDGVANIGTAAFLSIQPLLANATQTGSVALITQSGATAGSVLTRLASEGIGCKYYASSGNEIDLGLADYLSVAVQDPDVKLVLSYVESLRRPADFEKVAAYAAELGKPIVLIKVGRSEQGARRAAAHTGAMAGRDQMYDAMFQRLGIIRVDELAELVSVAKFFLSWGAPKTNGVGIFSVSGGQAGAVADQAAQAGLGIPELSPDAEKTIDELLEFGSGFNPCDLTGEIARKPILASQVYEVFSQQSTIGSIVYARKTLSGVLGTRAAQHLVESVGPERPAPLAIYAFDDYMPEDERAIYDTARIPVFGRMHELCVAIARLAEYSDRAPRVAALQARARPALADPTADPRQITSERVDELLASYPVRRPAQATFIDVREATDYADGIGYPVVLKVADADIAHKTEAGGVELGLGSAAEVRTAFDRIHQRTSEYLGRAPQGISVHEQVPPGIEMIVGAVVDPVFGAFVVVGFGGIWTEVLHDVAMRAAPIDATDAAEMIQSLRVSALLKGVRGAPPADIDALIDVMVTVSRLVNDNADEIAEVDLNPVIVLQKGQGVRVVDTLITGFEVAR